MSLRTSFLPTPVSTFIEFLNGRTNSSAYDENFLSVLSSFLYESLRHRYDEFVSIQMKGLQQPNDSPSIQDVDVINFLISVFPSISHISCPGPAQKAFSSLSKTSCVVFFGWLNGYRESELEAPLNSASQTPLFGILSRSRVTHLLHHLLEEGGTFTQRIDDEDITQKCNEIKDVIIYDLMEYLRNLSNIEGNTRLQRNPSERDLRSLTREVVSGGPNQQDGTSQDIEHAEWFFAWEDEFRGSALENLELKLRLNVEALQTTCKDKIGMSRIIPIVQSSGTGKSRLAEQYATNTTLS